MNRKSGNRLLIAGLAFAGVVVGVGVCAASFGYRLNPTTSLPPGLWHRDIVMLSMSGDTIRGRVVEFCPPQTDAFALARDRGYIQHGLCPGGYEPLFKPVVALPGDTVTIDAGGVRVNDVAIARSAPLAADGTGGALPVVAAGTYSVAPGNAWVVSDYSRWSFDSRYFGPIPIAAIDATMRQVLVENVPEAWR